MSFVSNVTADGKVVEGRVSIPEHLVPNWSLTRRVT